MKKSKFNKPDTVYPHGSLREQPEMKEPDSTLYSSVKDLDRDIILLIKNKKL